MKKLHYCLNCNRVFDSGVECLYCKSKKIRELAKNAPVNVIGSKLKGRVFKIEEESVKLILLDESNGKTLKDFEASKIKKII